ncbi:hypothetical protein PHLCEN_2v7258 [Hermanssonia centrifuga]|uniref:Altered inheritance of mitochondria protein 9, mitochondrial n=1 Tax=Hermanssonia centrifuga TaxID=98765 RepID=A0A2R6NX23_9APHY|nr:hypothetical protein PHLCEN_2v7258 [Hermanssonia centrifuga]
MPVAGPPWMTTASEVATMTFAREVLNVPAPRVLAWSSDAASNAVGSAYIIMEKIDGQILLDRWPLVTDGGDAATMLFEFAGIEKKFQRVPFSQIGSLYFKEDVSPELQDRPLFHAAACDLDDIFQAAAKRYRVGPISNRQWWRGERASMRLDRGPCKYL